MSSRRKSTTPCMLLPSDVEEDPDMEVTEERAAEGSGDGPAEVLAASEPDLERDTSQPEGEDHVAHGAGRRGSYSESISDLTLDGGFVEPDTGDGDDPAAAAISLSKTPIMRMKSKGEPKRIAVALKAADEVDGVGDSEGEREAAEAVEAVLGSLTPPEPGSPLPPAEALKPGFLLNFPSGAEQKQRSVLGSGPVLPAGLAQVLSALQAQQSAQAQLLIPLSSIPSYNAAMDSNPLLASTYRRFPYPSVAEILGLAAQTKFSEEQIKIWFSAQRLKHGVSWTPEEVEEARRKQFNGTVHTVPQTITVIPAHHFSAAANGLQSILQTCQIVGQSGLMFTQVGTTSSLPVTSPITLTVAGAPQGQTPRVSSSRTSLAGSELKRATTVQPPSLTPQENSALSADHFGMRPKKSKEQLAELKASYLRNHFASDAEIARLMKLTALTKGEIKKWFSDTRYNQRNSKNSHVIVFHDGARGGGAGGNATIVIDSSDETPQSPPPAPPPPVRETRPKTWNPFPDFTLQKFKEKTPEQLVVLEESYRRSDLPSDEELSRLRTETKLTRREIDAWFTERRKTLGPSSSSSAAAAAEPAEPGAERGEAAGSSPSSSRRGGQTPPGGRRSGRDAVGKKSPEQLHLLKRTFVRTQWPSAEDYDRLAGETGLPRPYIVNWFGDSRYAWKNGNLKWFFSYQSGNAEGVNGNKSRKRRVRNRGWGRSRSRKAKRSSSAEKSPPIRLKTGRDILREYYLKHRYLNEQDLDELVAKASMGYEQVREWFAEVQRREDMGSDPFKGAAENEEEAGGEESEGRDEVGAVPEERSATVAEEEEEEDEDDTDDSEAWEPSRGVRRSLSGPEDQ